MIIYISSLYFHKHAILNCPPENSIIFTPSGPKTLEIFDLMVLRNLRDLAPLVIDATCDVLAEFFAFDLQLNKREGECDKATQKICTATLMTTSKMKWIGFHPWVREWLAVSSGRLAPSTTCLGPAQHRSHPWLRMEPLFNKPSHWS